MIGVDVGGTFTDVVAVRDGRIEVTKVPSDASAPATAVVEGARRLGATVTFSQFELALQGRRVMSCQNGNVRMRRDLPLFVGMLEDGRLDAAPIITSRYALDDINEALAASADKRDLTGVIVPNGRS